MASVVVYLTRHGQTDWNLKKLIQGQTDIPLNENGISQAEKTRELLASVKLRASYASDLSRATKTAQVITTANSFETITTPHLRERAFGRYEGRPSRLIEEEYVPLKLKFSAINKISPYLAKPIPDVESDAELMDRLLLFFQFAASQHNGENILAVSHGGSIRQVLIHIGLASESGSSVVRIANTAYVALETDGVLFNPKAMHGIEIKDNE